MEYNGLWKVNHGPESHLPFSESYIKRCRNMWNKKKNIKNKKECKVNLPFIQFFWGWKWKAVLCQENMAFVQLYETWWKLDDGLDFVETPWATPLGNSCILLEMLWPLWFMISATNDIRKTMEPNVTMITFDGVLWLLSTTLGCRFSKGVCRAWSWSGVIVLEGLLDSILWLCWIWLLEDFEIWTLK